jgi:hypothetical protein
MKNTYSIGDRFHAKGCREYDMFELKEIINTNSQKTYILEGLKWKQVFSVPEIDINHFYYQVM